MVSVSGIDDIPSRTSLLTLSYSVRTSTTGRPQEGVSTFIGLGRPFHSPIVGKSDLSDQDLPGAIRPNKTVKFPVGSQPSKPS